MNDGQFSDRQFYGMMMGTAVVFFAFGILFAVYFGLGMLP